MTAQSVWIVHRQLSDDLAVVYVAPTKALAEAAEAACKQAHPNSWFQVEEYPLLQEVPQVLPVLSLSCGWFGGPFREYEREGLDAATFAPSVDSGVSVRGNGAVLYVEGTDHDKVRSEFARGKAEMIERAPQT